MLRELQFPNPENVFTPVFHKLYNCKSRFVINYGGTGSSKSFSAAQKEVLLSVQERLNTLVVRKVGATLKDSVIPSFKNRISEFGVEDIFVENKNERTITCTQNKSVFLFRGIDDPEKMKSIEGIDRIVIEEASELYFDDFLELNRRVRGRENIQVTLNFNPIHEHHWLKTHFFDQDVPNCEIFKSTYKDNPFLTKSDKEQIEWLEKYNYNQYRIYALGDWGLEENDAPWLYSFDADKHVVPDINFLPQYPVVLTFDFNREPLACVAIQHSGTFGNKSDFIHVIKEFYDSVQLQELCNRIKFTFPNSIFFVTGDCSGNKGDVGYEGRNDTHYTMVKQWLGISTNCMNTNTHNLEHHDSRNLINQILHSHPAMKISKKGCPTLVNDCQIAKVDDKKPKGGMLKKDRTLYKMDVFDAWRYFFQTYYLHYIKRM